MVSWTTELIHAAITDKQKLGQILNVHVPEDFPNQPVKVHILPAMLKELEQNPDDGQWNGLIIHAEDRIVIGSMGFKAIPDDQGNVEIGCDIIPKYQGHGYATEMAQAFIQWAFDSGKVNRVKAECLKSNIPSIRVLEKVGMRQIGTSENMLYWEILKQDLKV